MQVLIASVFIYCYANLAIDLTQAMFLGLGSLFIRQFGHAVLEPACHEEEATLLGFNTPSKSIILGSYFVIPLIVLWQAGTWSFSGFLAAADTIALQWFRFTLIVVFGRVALLTVKHDFNSAMIWFVKLVTDPFTDVITYFPRRRTQGA